jgi:hypothetical protein
MGSLENVEDIAMLVGLALKTLELSKRKLKNWRFCFNIWLKTNLPNGKCFDEFITEIPKMEVEVKKREASLQKVTALLEADLEEETVGSQ